MIGDKLVITEYHREGAATMLPALRQALTAGKKPLTTFIAGESGSGKSEIANCVAISAGPDGSPCDDVEGTLRPAPFQTTRQFRRGHDRL